MPSGCEASNQRPFFAHSFLSHISQLLVDQMRQAVLIALSVLVIEAHRALAYMIKARHLGIFNHVANRSHGVIILILRYFMQYIQSRERLNIKSIKQCFSFYQRFPLAPAGVSILLFLKDVPTASRTMGSARIVFWTSHSLILP